jgi:CRISPR-associated protein Cas2
MQYVICYDIADDGAGDARRSRLSNALLDFGKRVQQSVFLADLDEELAARMNERLRALIDHRFDRLHVFALCAACEGRVWSAGLAEVPEDKPFYVI